ncbi:metalloregulator ArsR/SmtB family transcription factor [bacterium]|nr:metalloregulator ArsR/SmtB family transcription factor [bacterium]MCI0607151.1 metalloregulator ArsR/SmtB family transcription factor [bacterium]
MVEYQSETLNNAFLALSDPTRRAILDRLRRGPARVTELAAPFDVSLNAISKHLKILERAGLIQRRISGRNHECSLNVEPLRTASAWIDTYEKFWEEQLAALENHLISKRKKIKGEKNDYSRKVGDKKNH